MKREQIGLALSLALALASAGAALAAEPNAPATAPSVELLARRYADKLNGFSLRPPANAEQTREASPTRLVSWAVRDRARAGAIAWTLTVLHVSDKKPETDLKSHASALTEKLTAEEGFRVDSSDVIQVAGKGAIDIRGLSGGRVQLWQRQTWILAQPGRFLILLISGPQDRKDQLLRIHQAVLDSMAFTDPRAALEAEKANLDRGKKLLASLTDANFTATVSDRQQWFLMRMGKQDIGWLLQTETATREDKAYGVGIRTWASINPPKETPRFQKRILFFSASGSAEHWKETVLGGPGTNAVLLDEEGIKQAELVVCTVSQGGKTLSRNKPAPQDLYLPRAVGMMLPRLVDLNSPAAYAFAVYNSQINDFDLRTFTVAGPEKITLGGKEVQAVHITDVTGANDDTLTDWWVDSKGLILRMTTPDGFVMESAPREDVFAKYPQAGEKVPDTNK